MDDDTLDREFRRATTLRDLGRFAEASEIMERLVSEFPDRKGPLIGLFTVYFNADDFVNALRVVREAVRVAPRSELASLGLFHSLIRNGLLDEALAEMARFLALQPDSPEYRLLKEEMGEEAD